MRALPNDVEESNCVLNIQRLSLGTLKHFKFDYMSQDVRDHCIKATCLRLSLNFQPQ
ncbi:uncharacterized protein LY89DRAFT_680885 [Mollisia scopiformis]|uniref:Uncharacterized protein n=1 Tax=Mollisia scopiformis TaxID=149040 RepID=A0A194XRU8_MOLSC|nr:uncharacterized protein LY89DRAFT_680885 [Mollisia scopiformis]KUJ22774.1 hypothetical protein LY89DRAFT_680885 [Mollisia scopiformis]